MKLLIRRLFNKLGYDLVKKNYTFKPGKLDKTKFIVEYKWLIDYSFGTVIDIGANEGQFSDRIRSLLPKAMIYAFEPLPKAFSRLKHNFIGDPNFKAFDVALGESDGQISFHENEYSQSSSILEASKDLKKNFSYTSETLEITVPINSLDEIMENEKIKLPLLVKIDVQGYEDHVINGGVDTIKKASVILCEVSFVELYKNQVLFSGIFEQLKKIGFEYAGSLEQIRSSETNRVLQADAIFIKTAKIN